MSINYFLASINVTTVSITHQEALSAPFSVCPVTTPSSFHISDHVPVAEITNIGFLKDLVPTIFSIYILLLSFKEPPREGKMSLLGRISSCRACNPLRGSLWTSSPVLSNEAGCSGKPPKRGKDATCFMGTFWPPPFGVWTCSAHWVPTRCQLTARCRNRAETLWHRLSWKISCIIQWDYLVIRYVL